MVRILALGLTALTACNGLANAQSTGQGGSQYVQEQPRHKSKVKKVDAFTLKQSNARKTPGNVKWSDIELKR
jgi:hypothetical protein